jgi:MFS family permease
VWLLPAIIITAVGQYFLWNYYELTGSESLKLWVSIAGGVAAVFIGLLGATLSLEFVWMRLGHRYGYFINGPICAIISGIAAFLLCGAILSILQNDPYNPMSQAHVQATYMLMQFGVGASMFWGFILGSWFAMRCDKYFIEQI